MRRGLFIVAIILLGTSLLNAQVIFSKSYSLEYLTTGESIQPTSDGGYTVLCAGSQVINESMLMVKIKADGELEWEKKISIDKLPLEPVDHITLPDNESMVLAVIKEYNKPYRTILIKLDSGGNILNYKEIEYPLQLTPVDLLRLSDGNLVIGAYDGTAKTNQNSVIIKMDINYREVWKQVIEMWELEAVRKIIETKEKEILVAARYFDHNGAHPYLVKINEKGEITWKQIYKDDTGLNGSVVSIAEDSEENILMVVNTFGDRTGCDVAKVKLNKKGQIIWREAIDGLEDEWAKDLFLIGDQMAVIGMGCGRKYIENYIRYHIFGTDNGRRIFDYEINDNVILYEGKNFCFTDGNNIVVTGSVTESNNDDLKLFVEKYNFTGMLKKAEGLLDRGSKRTTGESSKERKSRRR